METLNLVAAVLGIISGLAFIVTFIGKLYRWHRSRVTALRESEEAVKDLISKLVDQATNGSRRADIYAYLQSQVTSVTASRTQTIVVAFSFATMVALFEIFFFLQLKLSTLSPVSIVFGLGFVLFTNTLVLVGVFEFFRLDSRYSNLISKVSQVLYERATSHLQDREQ